MVTIPDGVPVTDAEAKALKEKGLEREIDLARAEIADHADEPHKPMDPTLRSVIDAIKQPVAAAPINCGALCFNWDQNPNCLGTNF